VKERGAPRALALALVLLGAARAHAQSPYTEHTLRLDSAAAPPGASVEDLAWLAGHWVGQGLGGISEEMWAPPRAGQMLGMYRLVVGEETRLFELITLLEVDDRVVLRLKHFDADLRAWEEPEEFLDFPLLRLDGRTAYFSGLTFDGTTPDRLRIWLVLTQGGVRREEAFDLRRVVPAGGSGGGSRGW
jgi:hypothetical protein